MVSLAIENATLSLYINGINFRDFDHFREIKSRENFWMKKKIVWIVLALSSVENWNPVLSFSFKLKVLKKVKSIIIRLDPRES